MFASKPPVSNSRTQKIHTPNALTPKALAPKILADVQACQNQDTRPQNHLNIDDFNNHSAPNWFYKLRKKTCTQQIDLSGAIIISDIAKSSPAASLHLIAGDAILTVNGMPAAGLDITKLLLDGMRNNDTITYQIFSPSNLVLLEVEMLCLPLGVRERPRLIDLAKNNSASSCEDKNKFETFCELWENEDYQNILNLSEIINAQNNKGLVARIIGKTRQDYSSLFMSYIVEYENSNENETAFKGFLHDVLGSDNLTMVQEGCSQDWPDSFRAIAYYYLAIMAKNNAEMLYYSEYIRQASKLNPNSKRIQNTAKLIGLHNYDRPSLLGKLVPDHYKFKIMENNFETDLQNLLGHLLPAQVLPVCFMPEITISGNNINSAFTKAVNSYHLMGGFVGTILAPMVIIRRQAQDRHTNIISEHEKRAIADGLPITRLEIIQGDIFADLAIKTSPEFLVISKSGRVIWEEGLYDCYDYWNLLHSLSGSSLPLDENGFGIGSLT